MGQSNHAVTYSILLNGRQPTNIINPTRGIRQGDPLSPYLFILCAEGLSSLISQAIENGIVQASSGQKINEQKTSVVFSSNAKPQQQAMLADVLQVTKVNEHDRYLGLPLKHGRRHKYYTKHNSDHNYNHSKSTNDDNDEFDLWQWRGGWTHSRNNSGCPR
ncbi:hypothetical protein ACLB2K_035118 [Fragaria x ananassa]